MWTLRCYESVVLSEILEHLEDPIAALRAVRERLEPGGTVFINVPATPQSPITSIWYPNRNTRWSLRRQRSSK